MRGWGIEKEESREFLTNLLIPAGSFYTKKTEQTEGLGRERRPAVGGAGASSRVPRWILGNVFTVTTKFSVTVTLLCGARVRALHSILWTVAPMYLRSLLSALCEIRDTHETPWRSN